MKKLLTTLSVLSLTAGLATAGDWAKNPPPAPLPPAGCDAFGTGFEFSGFIAGVLSDGAGDELGGGAALAYFFTENIGVETSYTAAAFESTAHIITTNVIARMPMRDLCFAPYLIAGGGLITNGSTEGLWDLGAGVDFRGFSSFGLFADATYNWVGGDSENFTLIRAGVRIPF